MDKMVQLPKKGGISVNRDTFRITSKPNKNVKYRITDVVMMVVWVIMIVVIAGDCGFRATYDNIYYYKYLAIVGVMLLLSCFTAANYLKRCEYNEQIHKSNVDKMKRN